MRVSGWIAFSNKLRSSQDSWRAGLRVATRFARSKKLVWKRSAPVTSSQKPVRRSTPSRPG